MSTSSARASGSPLAALAIAGLTALTAASAVASLAVRPRRRFFASPSPAKDQIFGFAGTAVLALAAVSGVRVWNRPASPGRTRALALWASQLALNANWMRLFFARHKTRAAFADLVALWATLGAYMLQTRAVDRKAAHLMAPYLGWVTAAGYLNEELIRKNKKLLLN